MTRAVWHWRFPVDPQHPEPVVLQVTGPVSVKAGAGDEVSVKAVGEGSRDARSVRVFGPVKVTAAPYAVLHFVDCRGPIRVEGLTQGHVRLARVTGPVRLLRVAQVDAEGVHGPIHAEAVTERLALEASTGPLKVVGLPKALQARVDGVVQVEAPTLDGQQMQVRASQAVLVQVPASTAAQGRLEAPEIWVDLTDPAYRGAGAFELQAPNPDLHIVATSDVAVYLGPEPPTAWQGTGVVSGWSRFWRELWHWLTWLTRWTRDGRLQSQGRTRPAPTAGTEDEGTTAAVAEDDIATARRRILDMLAAGKLTAEEAAELLEALER
ncbi:MAG: hypothetical protein GXO36_01330 [Chloroflexi bacterium]|nr:hypothetical protein [Chloroflexota bacterium]